MKLIKHPAADYSFLQGIAPYSAGVIANPGFDIVRVRLSEPKPVIAGTFNRIKEYLDSLDQPMHALCAMELRIKEPLSFAGFEQFNNRYRDILAQYGLLPNNVNPIARTNISPVSSFIREPSIYAFSHTSPLLSGSDLPGFVVAGAGDLKDQASLTPETIIRSGQTGPEAMREKADAVMQVMSDRLAGLGMEWNNVSAVDVYTVYPIHSFLRKMLLDRIGKAALHGITWHYSQPPIQGLTYEMDVRGVCKEVMVTLT